MVLERTKIPGWIVPIGILVVFMSIVMLAPAEKTLGETIRLIYVHAALTRAGMIGFYIAGLLGAVVAVTANDRWSAWAQTAGWVSLALFLLGGLMSIFAQQATWGGSPMAEPRNRTSLTIIAIAIIVLIVNTWIPWIRAKGLLFLFLAWYVAWVIPRTPLLLHPQNAGGTSPSPLIRLTFPVLTALALLLGAWSVWYFQNGREHG